MRLGHLTCTLLLVLAPSANAQGQADLAGQALQLTGALKAERAKATVLRQEMDQLVAKNEGLLKEGKFLQEQVRTRLGPIAASVKADAARLKADTARHNQAVAAFNARCTGTLPQPQYQRCMSEKAQWDRNKASLDARKASLQARAADHDRRLEQYSARIRRIDAQMKQNHAAWQQKKLASEQSEARLKDHATRLNHVCDLAVQARKRGETENTSEVEQALGHCKEANWDGTNANERPLDNAKSPPGAD